MLLFTAAFESLGGSHAKDNPDLQRMLSDARKGMFDLIITRDISRFARNLVDIIRIKGELSSLNPPIGVYFESEKIYTLEETAEMMLALYAVANDMEKECRWKAEHIAFGQDPRLRNGYFDVTDENLGKLKL